MNVLRSVFIVLSAFAVLNFVYSIVISLYFDLSVIHEACVMTLLFLMPLGLIPLINVGIRRKSELMKELGDVMLVNRKMFKFNLGVFLVGCVLVFTAALVCAATTPEGPKLAFVKSISIFLGLLALMIYTCQLDKFSIE